MSSTGNKIERYVVQRRVSTDIHYKYFNKCNRVCCVYTYRTTFLLDQSPYLIQKHYSNVCTGLEKVVLFHRESLAPDGHVTRPVFSNALVLV